MNIGKILNGYEGLYQVSSFGRIKSLRNNTIRKQYQAKNGYMYIDLWKQGKSQVCLVHRLVAQEFLCNPNNLSQINHKDEDKKNNKLNNLEWCTSKYNMNYGNGAKTRHKKIDYKKISEKMKISQISVGNNNATPVLQFDMLGNFIKKFDCEIDAIREMRAKSNHIPEVCKGKRKSFKGFIWKYERGNDLSVSQY